MKNTKSVVSRLEFTIWDLGKKNTLGSKNKGSYTFVMLKGKNTTRVRHLGLRRSGFSF